jgi:hypothetical protein
MKPISIRILALLAGLSTFAFLPSAASAGDWGAIALSTATGSWGTSYNYDDEDEARSRAMRECRKHASDCKVFRTFENTCVALAGDKSGNFGWAWGYTNRTVPPRDRTVPRSRWPELQGRDDVLHRRRQLSGDSPLR